MKKPSCAVSQNLKYSGVPTSDFIRISFKELQGNIEEYVRLVKTYYDHYIFKFNKKDMCLVPYNPKYVTLTLDLPQTTIKALEKLAKKNKISLEELVRRILKTYIESGRKAKKKRK